MDLNSPLNLWFSIAYEFQICPILEHFEFALMGPLDTRIWFSHNKYILGAPGHFGHFSSQNYGFSQLTFFLFLYTREWLEWMREWRERKGKLIPMVDMTSNSSKSRLLHPLMNLYSAYSSITPWEDSPINPLTKHSILGYKVKER